ncbi:dihydroxyacetone kinase [Lineolata rhizophorae]|uniref:Dihydroxyacetone kinase n=1 Tax=Lineolata rhizophorae TaxID=578093 RepID=A0A6A6PEG1_9PEZI|nr:dihydroxyacetone kinase [Lineolata rhizophorae]
MHGRTVSFAGTPPWHHATCQSCPADSPPARADCPTKVRSEAIAEGGPHGHASGVSEETCFCALTCTLVVDGYHSALGAFQETLHVAVSTISACKVTASTPKVAGMSSKHFINDPVHLVSTALRAATLTNPSAAVDAENKIIYRRGDAHKNAVSLVSGGGSGHEPSFAALVGSGLLTGSVAGTIFASPGAEQVRRCILGRVPGEKGVIVIVMNYTGDVLNFGMAVEKAKATGIDVEMVVVADDVGVGRSQGGKVGRRGIAGTVLVHKISGALAATGASLKDVAHVANLTASNLVSIGASLSHVHVPGRSASDDLTASLAANEAELGMGIHNEAGSGRHSADLPSLVCTMLAQLLDPTDNDRAFLSVSSNDKTVLLVNNLGGVSVLEMGGVTAEVVKQLEEAWGIHPARIISGTFMTSLNGLGFSITLLKLADTGLGPGKSMLELLDAPAEVTGWSAPVKSETWNLKAASSEEASKIQNVEAKPSNLRLDFSTSKTILDTALSKLINVEPEVTKYDTMVGDGDCGIGLKRGAEAIQKLLSTTEPTDDPSILLARITQAVETTMDGTSGALYAIFLNSLTHGLNVESPTSPANITSQVWARALQSSLKALGKYTPAQPGDRTLMDALVPFVEVLSKSGSTKEGAKAAMEGAAKTKGMKASLGRTVYVGGEDWKDIPDPGAWGLANFLQGLGDAVGN